jgi:hypothetical protein
VALFNGRGRGGCHESRRGEVEDNGNAAATQTENCHHFFSRTVLYRIYTYVCVCIQAVEGGIHVIYGIYTEMKGKLVNDANNENVV